MKQELPNLEAIETLHLDARHGQAYAELAAVWRRVQQHEQTLEELAYGACRDARFAPWYCNQRALIHSAQGQYGRAAADYTVTLLLDPDNATARAGRERAWKSYLAQGRQPLSPPSLPTDKDQASPALFQTPAESLASNEADLFFKVALPPANLPAEEPGPQPPKPTKASETSRQEKKPGQPQEDKGASEAAEQILRRMKAERRKKGVQTVGQAHKPLVEKEDDQPLPLWKKGLLVAASLLLVWWLGAAAMSLFAGAANHGPLAAETICRDFQTNPEDARQKYVSNAFAVSGKVKLLHTPKGKRLVFDTTETGWTIHCLFANPKSAAKIHGALANKREQTEVTVDGQCQLDPKGAKGVIVLEDCVILKGL